MTRYLKKLLLYLLLTFILFTFLIHPNIIIVSVNDSLKVFRNSLFSSLFPFLILSDILNYYNYFDFLKKIFKFKHSDILLLCAVSGLPSNAKYISNLLENDEIEKEEAQYLISCTFFPNPMYVVSVVGLNMLGNKIIGFVFLIIIYLSNIIYFIFNYKKFTNDAKIKASKKQSFFHMIKNSIINNIEILLIILGTLVIFNISLNILKYYTNINIILLSLFNLFLEMTSGINKISQLSLNISLKCILVCTSLTFSGISVISQVISIISKYNLNIKFIIKQKIVITIISILLSSIYFLLISSI